MTGIAYHEMGIRVCRQIAEGIADGNDPDPDCVRGGRDPHGHRRRTAGKLETLVVSDILPNATTRPAHYLLPGCAHAEKRGTFMNAKGRVQKFLKAVEPPGMPGRSGSSWRNWVASGRLGSGQQDEFTTMEGLFNRMARRFRRLRESSGPNWATGGARSGI
jgi:anaerobic selenocysteine-containing dehydrogenase